MQIDVTDTRWVDLSFINARTLSVTHNFEAPKITKENKDIIEIQLGTYAIKVGTKIEISVSKTNKNKVKYFKVNKIIENRLGFDLVSESITKSSLFLLPLITGKYQINQLYKYDTYFYNAYLYNKNCPEYNDGKHLFVVYRFFDTEGFKELESVIHKNPNYVKAVEPNSNYTMYIFEIPKLLQSDSKLFIRGKYSRMSTTAKSKIITFHQAKLEDWIGLVLYKQERLKRELENSLNCCLSDDLDLYDKPIKEQESYETV